MGFTGVAFGRSLETGFQAQHSTVTPLPVPPTPKLTDNTVQHQSLLSWANVPAGERKCHGESGCSTSVPGNCSLPSQLERHPAAERKISTPA